MVSVLSFFAARRYQLITDAKKMSFELNADVNELRKRALSGNQQILLSNNRNDFHRLCRP